MKNCGVFKLPFENIEIASPVGDGFPVPRHRASDLLAGRPDLIPLSPHIGRRRFGWKKQKQIIIKRYVLYHIAFILLCCILLMLGFHLYDPGTAIFAAALIGFSMICFCWRVLALPLDLLAGSVTKELFFSSQSSEPGVFFPRQLGYTAWKFYRGGSETITLLVLAEWSAVKEERIQAPPKDRRLTVKYYRFSKILLCWNEQNAGSEKPEPEERK